MCNAKSLITVVAVGAALYTGGASLGLLGTEAVAATAGSAATASTAAVAGTGIYAAGGVAAGMSTAQAVSLGLSATSAGVGALSAVTQAETQQKMANRNATVAGMQADDAIRRGDLASIDATRRGNAMQGAQRTALAARGLDLSEGTPNSVLAQTDFFTQSDAATAITNGRREAWADKAQQGNFQMQADASNPGLTMAASLLGGGSRVADRWYQYGGGRGRG